MTAASISLVFWFGFYLPGAAVSCTLGSLHILQLFLNIILYTGNLAHNNWLPQKDLLW